MDGIPALAAERDELLRLARFALDAQEPVLEPAALQIRLELVLDVARQWPALGRPPIPKLGMVLGDERVEQRRFRPVAPVARWGDESLRLRDVATRPRLASLRASTARA